MKILRLLTILTMLATLHQISSCARQAPEENNNQPQKPEEEELDKSLDEYFNRHIYDVLTNEIIDSVPDDQLLQTVYDNVVTKLPNDYRQEYETVLKWTPGQQAIFEICLMVGQVDNGGFNQFYYNASAQYSKLLPDALRLIGAEKFADLMERANKVYEQEKEEITSTQDGTIEGFSKSYEDNPLDDLDNEFYSLDKTENLAQIQTDYIRKHKEEFIDQ